MRIFILALLLLLSSRTNASGDESIANYYGDDYFIDITMDSGGCGSQICIIVIKNPSSKKSTSSSIPFDRECYLTNHGKKIKSDDYLSGKAEMNGFVCHSKGRTPLAGATYKNIQFGRSHHDDSCGLEKGPKYTEPLTQIYLC